MTSMPPLKGPFGVSIAAIGLTAVVVVAYAPSVVSSVNAPTTMTEDPSAELEEFLQRHETWRETSEDRFLGRSIFFRPSPWPAPPRETRTVARDPDPPPRRDPEPTGPSVNYMGPMPRAVMGDQVWFANDLRIRVGEEAQGVTVLAVQSPWTVRLGHGGGEYDVDVMTRHDPFGDANLASGSLNFEVQGSNQHDPETPPDRASPRDQSRSSDRNTARPADRRDRAREQAREQARERNPSRRE